MYCFNSHFSNFDVGVFGNWQYIGIHSKFVKIPHRSWNISIKSSPWPLRHSKSQSKQNNIKSTRNFSTWRSNSGFSNAFLRRFFALPCCRFNVVAIPFEAKTRRRRKKKYFFVCCLWLKSPKKKKIGLQKKTTYARCAKFFHQKKKKRNKKPLNFSVLLDYCYR